MSKVCVLGGGAWGTAIAHLLAGNGHKVHLWCREPEVVASILQYRENKHYLSDVILHENIMPTHDLADAVRDAQYIFEAVPVKFFRAILEQVKPFVTQSQVWIMLSKGIEQDTLFFPTQMVEDVLGFKPDSLVLAGPSFARDLAEQQITAVTLAAPHCEIGERVQKLLANHYFRPYVSLDVMSVQVGAALKNVVTLGIGMLDGAGYKDNVKAFVLTRGLHEITELAVILGGKQETVFGLSGVGDLVLTAMGSLSKNLAVGRRLGKGETLSDIQKNIGTLPEGINTVQAMHQLSLKSGLDLPICSGIYAVLFEGQSIDQFLAQLMRRPLEQECRIRY